MKNLTIILLILLSFKSLIAQKTTEYFPKENKIEEIKYYYLQDSLAIKKDSNFLYYSISTLKDTFNFKDYRHTYEVNTGDSCFNKVLNFQGSKIWINLNLMLISPTNDVEKTYKVYFKSPYKSFVILVEKGIIIDIQQ